MRELHLHLDGSLRPETVFDLAKDQGIDLGVGTVSELADKMTVPAEAASLNDYLATFDMPLKVLQKEEAITRVVYELIEDLHEMGLDYGEIRFAPQLSTAGGLSQSQVVEAAIGGVKKAREKMPDFRAGLILCMMRGADHEANRETIEMVKKYLGPVVCAIDLAGAEALFPTKDHKQLFDLVDEYELPRTIHAGEADGPESVKVALDFGTKRIGHGVRSIEDGDLVKRLIDEEVTLEVCIKSNIDTKMYDSYQDHPIYKLYKQGVRVTLNSDNIRVSDTNLLKEMDIARSIGFTDEDIEKMDQYAREASFLK